MNTSLSPERYCTVAIIGTGFSGLGMAIRLKQQGLDDFLLFEKEAGVGGAWRDNDYPGCACDVPSHLYSFSFEPNPNWTRMFAPQPEIRSYLQGCWEKYRLQTHTLLGTKVSRIAWDEQLLLWRIEDQAGNHYRAQFVVSGMGTSSNPSIPQLKGLENFTGKVFHSQQWDHSYDLSGKRVAVIGSGASAIQFVPRIQPRVARLDLYQSSAPWIMPKPDRVISAGERMRFKQFPLLQKLWRGAIYTVLEGRNIAFALVPRAIKIMQKVGIAHLKRQIKEPSLRAKLTPNDSMGCKRALLSNDYFPALTQANVELITDGIEEIHAHSIRSVDGRQREIDAIIFDTGFAPSEPLPRGLIFGRNGIDLLDTWLGGPQVYKGTLTAGFPNLFLLMDPNTGPGHSSAVHMIESQIHYVLDAIKLLEQQDLQSLEVKRRVQDSFNAKLQRSLSHTLCNRRGCTSCYLVNGHNCRIWPSFTWRFRWLTRNFDPIAYHFTRKNVTVSSPSSAVLCNAQTNTRCDQRLHSDTQLA